MSRLVLAVAVLVSSVAFATDSSSPLASLLTPANVIALLSLLLGALGGLSFMSARRKKIIALAAYHAFHIVEDIGNEMDGADAFDKTATYLAELDKWMLANGWRPLKDGEKALAEMHASSLHGEEVAKAKVAEAAVAAADPR